MSGRKYSKSFEIALSAISCSVAVIALSLGILSGYLLATGYFVAVIALMVPLSKQFYVGDALAYLGTCILTVLMGVFGNYWDIVPFIMFFGLHPLINCLQIRFKINRWIAYAIKALWFDFTLWVAYIIIFKLALGGDLSQEGFYKILNDYVYYFIFIGGTVVFLLYDYIVFKCQVLVNAAVYRIRK